MKSSTNALILIGWHVIRGQSPRNLKRRRQRRLIYKKKKSPAQQTRIVSLFLERERVRERIYGTTLSL